MTGKPTFERRSYPNERSKRNAGLAIFLAACAACHAMAADVKPSINGEKCDWIAFSSTDSERETVFVIKPDGSMLTNISKDKKVAINLRAWLPGSSDSLMVSVYNRSESKWSTSLVKIPSLETNALIDHKADDPSALYYSCCPDGKAAFVIETNKLVERQLQPSGQRKVIEENYSECPECSPNGNWVSFLMLQHDDSHQRSLWVYSRRDEKKYMLIGEKAVLACWCPDDRLIAWASDALFEVAVPSGKSRKIADGYQVCVSPKGTFVAFLSPSNERGIPSNVAVINVATLKSACTFDSGKFNFAPRSAPRSMSWSADEHKLALIAEDWTKEDIAFSNSAPPSSMGRMDHTSSLIVIDISTGEHKVIHETKEPIFDLQWSQVK